jgi:hypothetical protein
MQNNPKQNDFSFGLTIKLIIAGRLNRNVKQEDIKSKVLVVNKLFQLMKILVKHQNVETYSSYNPRWTGNIAFNTEDNKSKSPIQGIQIIATVNITTIPIAKTYKRKIGNYLRLS